MSGPINNIHTRTLISRLYTEAADEDYLVARFSFQFGMGNQFSWSAQQAIEKYLKGALLLNEVSVRNFSHDLLPLLAEVQTIAGSLLPSLLCPPSVFPSGFWGAFEPLESSVRRFDENGSPDQRYRLHGHLVRGHDLHHLDEICFQLRRVNIPLTAIGSVAQIG